MSSRHDASRLRMCALSRIVLQHGVRGGMERHLELIGRGLRQCGHDVTVLTTSHPDGRSREETDWGTIHYLPGMRPGAYWPRWHRDALEAAGRLHAEEPLDLVLSEGAAAESYARAKAGRALPPLACFMHGTLWGEVANHRHAFRTLAGLRHTVRYLPPMLHHALFWRSYVRRADLLVAVSGAVKKRIVREYGVDASRIAVIPNGIDLGRFRPDRRSRDEIRERIGIGPDDILLTTIGRLVREKGVHIAIEALALVIEAGHPTKLMVVGDGPQRRQLEAMVAANGMEGKVVFAGLASEREIPQYIGASDQFLLPTLRHEGLPFTLLEAMACGRPGIVAGYPGVDEVVRHRQDGLIVEPGDPRALAGAIIQLICQPALGERIARSARARIESHYGVETMVRRTTALLEECARGRVA